MTEKVEKNPTKSVGVNKENQKGWNAFMELRRQAQRGSAAGMSEDDIDVEITANRMLRTMQQLSADAKKAGSADMTLDEINVEISAGRTEMAEY